MPIQCDLSKTQFKKFMVNVIRNVLRFLPSQIVIAFLLSLFPTQISNGNPTQKNIKRAVLMLSGLFVAQQMFNIYFPEPVRPHHH